MKIIDYRIIRESNGWYILELKFKFLCFSWWYQPAGFSSYFDPQDEMNESIKFLIHEAEDDMKRES